MRAVDGVAAAEPSIQAYAQLVGIDGKAIGNSGQGPPTFGGNWTIDGLNPFTLFAGHEPRSGNEVVIDKASSDAGGLTIGTETTVLLRSGVVPVTVVGIARFGELDSPAGASYVLFTDEAAQRLLTEPGRFDGVAVVADKGVSQATLQQRISAALPSTLEVVTGEKLTAENQTDIKQGLSFFSVFLVTFAAISLFVGSFIIYNTFSILVAQRGRETALLRAIGASRRQVLGSILLEALAVGVVSSAVGVVAGVGFALALKALLAGFGIDVPAETLVVSARTVMVGLGLGTVVSVASAVVPARRAAKVAPVEAMRETAIESAHHSTRRVVLGGAISAIGAGLIAAALLGGAGAAAVGAGVPVAFIGIAVLGPVLAGPIARVLGAPVAATRGMTGTLARNNAVRNPARTSATASALMIGVGLVVFIIVFAASAKASLDATIERSFGADLVVGSDNFGAGGLPVALGQQISALPEVGRSASIRVGGAEIDGVLGPLVAVGPEIEGLLDLNVAAGKLSDLGTDGVALSEGRAADKGLALGDQVEITFKETGTKAFVVRALYRTRQLGGDVVMSQAAWEANASEQLDSQILIGVASGSTIEQAKASVSDVLRPYPTAQVQDRSEFKAAQTSQINQLLGLIYALLGLAILIAVLGIANTLALSILERTRELGLLRAVGMTRGQLRATVRWESVLIALFGTTLGTVVGVLFGAAMVLSLADQGIGAVVLPVGQLAVVAALAALCGLVAAALPARRAAKLDVLAALAV